MSYILSPSLLAADFSRLGEEVKAVEVAGAKYLHLDVMDGRFVPSISFGMPLIASLKKVCPLVFDVHLMIEEPDRYLADFARAGADIITVHVEAVTHLDRTIHAIHDLGLKAGVALNPATPLSVLDWVLPETDMVLLMTVNPGFGGQKYIEYCDGKIRALRRRVQELSLNTDIQVDGGIQLQNLERVLEAGANVIVAGSAVFGGETASRAAAFMEILEKRNLSL
ncbi:MAG: ribulose-phosphate 3-epimerase [Lachnospiraceae bacterium]|nr:ribulose-phosphate 3-epimerase [Lachnospiraceae bacterium]